MPNPNLIFRALLAASMLIGLAHAQTTPDVGLPSTDPAKIPELRAGSGYLIGYLPRKDLPNSLQLLPVPPASGSAAAAADLDFHQQLQGQRSGLRWELAAQDAVLKFPAVASTFSCALGVSISQEATPHLNMLLRRSLADAGLSTYAAKDKYQVQRPFVKLAQATCSPADEAALTRDGSYPSGHAAVGWAWGLILTELAPERSQALLERAYAFGRCRGQAARQCRFCGPARRRPRRDCPGPRPRQPAQPRLRRRGQCAGPGPPAVLKHATALGANRASAWGGPKI